MVLRCSLLGHDYGDPEIEREREERGSEVVLTVEEFEECARCGDRNVISENTEVTSLEPDPTGDAAVPNEEPTGDGPTGDEPADAAELIDDAGADDAELIDETTDDGPAPGAAASPEQSGDAPVADAATAEAAGAEAPADAAAPNEVDDESTPGSDHPAVDDPEADVPTDDDGEPIVDDAEILEDEPDARPESDRQHGEWPESEDVGPPESGEGSSTAWPESDAAASAADAPGPGGVVTEPAEGDDAAIVDADPAGSGDHPAASSSGASGSGIASARSAPAPGESAPREDVPTEFFCPQCDFVASGDRGSLRPGDICPDCRKGYLSERER